MAAPSPRPAWKVAECSLCRMFPIEDPRDRPRRRRTPSPPPSGHNWRSTRRFPSVPTCSLMRLQTLAKRRPARRPPSDVMLATFAFLRTADLVRAAAVCGDWRAATRDDGLRRDVARRDARVQYQGRARVLTHNWLATLPRATLVLPSSAPGTTPLLVLGTCHWSDDDDDDDLASAAQEESEEDDSESDEEQSLEEDLESDEEDACQEEEKHEDASEDEDDGTADAP
mmetsp:Transcript_16890/g.51228  ORF Transcript_16890/g.51228 Transcript_16890/m.51228 type:complete len:227 (+) Transcript_16890:60-740(+)